MTIEEKIKEIEGRWMRSIAHPVGVQEFEDVGFLITELKRCREALEKICSDRWISRGTSLIKHSDELLYRMNLAEQALHPEGVK